MKLDYQNDTFVIIDLPAATFPARAGIWKWLEALTETNFYICPACKANALIHRPATIETTPALKERLKLKNLYLPCRRIRCIMCELWIVKIFHQGKRYYITNTKGWV